MEIRLEQVSKQIRGTEILADITMELKSGVIYGFQGINGSGKTMLMRVIAGLIRPTKGCVKIDGKELGRELDFPEGTGLLLENPAFPGYYTGKRNLQLLAGIRGEAGDEKIEETMQRIGLDPGDKRKYRKYSLGMKQKLGIAAAVMESPRLLILDEPFNALDEESVGRARQIIREEKERGALIILACHERAMLEDLVDEIFILENGRLKGREGNTV